MLRTTDEIQSELLSKWTNLNKIRFINFIQLVHKIFGSFHKNINKALKDIEMKSWCY